MDIKVGDRIHFTESSCTISRPCIGGCPFIKNVGLVTRIRKNTVYATTITSEGRNASCVSYYEHVSKIGSYRDDFKRILGE